MVVRCRGAAQEDAHEAGEEAELKPRRQTVEVWAAAMGGAVSIGGSKVGSQGSAGVSVCAVQRLEVQRSAAG